MLEKVHFWCHSFCSDSLIDLSIEIGIFPTLKGHISKTDEVVKHSSYDVLSQMNVKLNFLNNFKKLKKID